MAMVLPTEWFNVLKRYDVAATKLPPTQICNLKFSATHRNTIPSTSSFFTFFYSVLSSLLFFPFL
jgi:hypothetical protein